MTLRASMIGIIKGNKTWEKQNSFGMQRRRKEKKISHCTPAAANAP
jgi:hypothetical protein